MEKMDAPTLMAALKDLGYTANQQGQAILFSEAGSYRVFRGELGWKRS